MQASEESDKSDHVRFGPILDAKNVRVHWAHLCTLIGIQYAVKAIKSLLAALKKVF